MILTREILYSDTCPMLLKKMVIYKIEDLLNGKIYIGETARTLAKRMKEHLKESRPCYIDLAINKYGIENFDVSIVDECETEEQLNEMEKFFIEFFGCKVPDGYNLTDGGEGILGYKAPPSLSQRLSEQRKGRPVTQQQRQAISKKKKGREFTAEHKANISAAKWGHTVDNDTREKLRNDNLGKKYSDEVCPKNLIRVKTSAPLFALRMEKFLNPYAPPLNGQALNNGTVSVACKNPNRTASGYHWQYADKKEEK